MRENHSPVHLPRDRHVVISVPHAGRRYPQALLDNSRVPMAALESLEDRFADLLAQEAEKRGYSVICADMARAWIDLNRAPDEVDPAMVSDRPKAEFAAPTAKLRAGLGLFPRSAGQWGQLWQRALPWAVYAARIDTVHRPYHEAIERLLLGMLGHRLLIDLHSMPPLTSSIDVVIGDRHGRSAAAGITAMIEQTVREAGFITARNQPYAGGYVLARHGDPNRDVHAVQLEFSRSLYLDAHGQPNGGGVAKIRRLVADIADRTECWASVQETDMAAE